MKRERVAIYCRLSEEDKGKGSAENDSNSIQNQRALLTEYAHSHGWEIYEIYIDDDYSGADRSRPAFKRMLHAAEEKRFDIILCKTQSRFSRELEVVERYINRLLPQWGIRFLSLVDNADSANEDNLLLRQINGIMDEHYLAELSKNIRSVLTHRRKNGFHIGSFALYGYRKNPDRRGHLLIDEEAAAVVHSRRATARLPSRACSTKEGFQIQRNINAYRGFAIGSRRARAVRSGNISLSPIC